MDAGAQAKHGSAATWRHPFGRKLGPWRSQGGQEQRQRRYALLTVDQEPASEASGGVAGRDIDHRAHEVATACRIVRDKQQVLPELLALRLGPTVVTLEDRDHELSRAIDDFGKWTVNGFHGILTWMIDLLFRPLL